MLLLSVLPFLWLIVVSLQSSVMKRITHMWKRWDTPQNFLLAFIDELWKTWKIRILKKGEKKKKKLLEISWFYSCVPKATIIMSTELHRILLSFWAIFCPFTYHSPNNPENQNFEKMKKASGDVLILNLSNKKHDHMMHAYSYMECNRHTFLYF